METAQPPQGRSRPRASRPRGRAIAWATRSRPTSTTTDPAFGVGQRRERRVHRPGILPAMEADEEGDRPDLVEVNPRRPAFSTR